MTAPRAVAKAILRDLRGIDVATTPSVRAVRRRFSKQLAADSPTAVLAIVSALLATDWWPARLAAFELIAEHQGVRRRLSASFVDKIAGGPR